MDGSKSFCFLAVVIFVLLEAKPGASSGILIRTKKCYASKVRDTRGRCVAIKQIDAAENQDSVPGKSNDREDLKLVITRKVNVPVQQTLPSSTTTTMLQKNAEDYSSTESSYTRMHRKIKSTTEFTQSSPPTVPTTMASESDVVLSSTTDGIHGRSSSSTESDNYVVMSSTLKNTEESRSSSTEFNVETEISLPETSAQEDWKMSGGSGFHPYQAGQFLLQTLITEILNYLELLVLF
jgi:hypothetical protein